VVLHDKVDRGCCIRVVADICFFRVGIEVWGCCNGETNLCEISLILCNDLYLPCSNYKLVRARKFALPHNTNSNNIVLLALEQVNHFCLLLCQVYFDFSLVYLLKNNCNDRNYPIKDFESD